MDFKLLVSKNQKILNLYLKLDIYRKKYIFWIVNRVYSDGSKLDISNGTIIFQNFHFSRKLWWKNWWKLTNFYVAEKPIVFKLKKILIEISIEQIEDLNEDRVKI